MRGASLQGADLLAASLQGADLRSVEVWLSDPPLILELANLHRLVPKRPDAKALKAMIAELPDEALRDRLAKRLERLLDKTEVEAWGASGEAQKWRDLSGPATFSPRALADFLARLSRDDDAGSYIVKGLARRLLPHSNEDGPYAKLLGKTLLDENCKDAQPLLKETCGRLRKFVAKSTVIEKPHGAPTPSRAIDQATPTTPQ